MTENESSMERDFDPDTAPDLSTGGWPEKLATAPVRRGRPPKARPKVSTTIRLSQDVISGWRTRVADLDQALQDWIQQHDMAPAARCCGSWGPGTCRCLRSNVQGFGRWWTKFTGPPFGWPCDRHLLAVQRSRGPERARPARTRMLIAAGVRLEPAGPAREHRLRRSV